MHLLNNVDWRPTTSTHSRWLWRYVVWRNSTSFCTLINNDSMLSESTCCGTVGFASYRPRLGVVPAVGRGGSKLCSLRPARRGKLLFVHRDVELGNHPHFLSYYHCLSLSLPESHEHPSPPLSPGAMAPPFPTHLGSLVLLVVLFSAKFFFPQL